MKLGSSSPWLQDFSSFLKFLQEISQSFQSYSFWWWISTWRCSFIAKESFSQIPPFRLVLIEVNIQRVVRGHALRNRVWQQADSWRLCFFVCQEAAKRPFLHEKHIWGQSPSLALQLVDLGPGERTESHHHSGAKESELWLCLMKLFKMGWLIHWRMCPRVKGLKSLMLFFCWLFHVSKIETSYMKIQIPRHIYEDGWCVDVSFTWHWAWITSTRIHSTAEKTGVSTATQQMLLRTYPV